MQPELPESTASLEIAECPVGGDIEAMPLTHPSYHPSQGKRKAPSTFQEGCNPSKDSQHGRAFSRLLPLNLFNLLHLKALGLSRGLPTRDSLLFCFWSAQRKSTPAPFRRKRSSEVFRRIDDRAQLGWMTREGLGQYFRHFLCGFSTRAQEFVPNGAWMVRELNGFRTVATGL